jgi:hypothetical protein
MGVKKDRVEGRTLAQIAAAFLGGLFLWHVLAMAALGTEGGNAKDTATTLAALLRAGRSVISANQDLINNPDVGAKELSGEKVLNLAAAAFQKSTGRDLASFPAETQTGRLLQLLGRSIRAVMDENKSQIDVKGVGFKGFIPAVFTREVADHFNELAHGEALLRVTAPMNVVRNRRVRPDAWENNIIETNLRSAQWTKGEPFQAETVVGDRAAFRMLIPEYYSASCLACHGKPAGEIDLSGYPKEGASEGDLGGVISILIFKE